MKVYYHGSAVRHQIFVTPASDYPHVTEWKEEDGRHKQIPVFFLNGEAEVDDRLGAYMVEKGLASSTKIILDLRGVA